MFKTLFAVGRRALAHVTKNPTAFAKQAERDVQAGRFNRAMSYFDRAIAACKRREDSPPLLAASLMHRRATALHSEQVRYERAGNALEAQRLAQQHGFAAEAFVQCATGFIAPSDAPACFRPDVGHATLGLLILQNALGPQPTTNLLPHTLIHTPKIIPSFDAEGALFRGTVTLAYRSQDGIDALEYLAAKGHEKALMTLYFMGLADPYAYVEVVKPANSAMTRLSSMLPAQEALFREYRLIKHERFKIQKKERQEAFRRQSDYDFLRWGGPGGGWPR